MESADSDPSIANREPLESEHSYTLSLVHSEFDEEVDLGEEGADVVEAPEDTLEHEFSCQAMPSDATGDLPGAIDEEMPAAPETDPSSGNLINLELDEDLLIVEEDTAETESSPQVRKEEYRQLFSNLRRN